MAMVIAMGLILIPQAIQTEEHQDFKQLGLKISSQPVLNHRVVQISKLARGIRHPQQKRIRAELPPQTESTS